MANHIDINVVLLYYTLRYLKISWQALYPHHHRFTLNRECETWLNCVVRKNREGPEGAALARGGDQIVGPLSFKSAGLKLPCKQARPQGAYKVCQASLVNGPQGGWGMTSCGRGGRRRGTEDQVSEALITTLASNWLIDAHLWSKFGIKLANAPGSRGLVPHRFWCIYVEILTRLRRTRTWHLEMGPLTTKR